MSKYLFVVRSSFHFYHHHRPFHTDPPNTTPHDKKVAGATDAPAPSPRLLLPPRGSWRPPQSSPLCSPTVRVLHLIGRCVIEHLYLCFIYQLLAQDFVGFVLLFINLVIGFYDEHGTGDAVKALIDSLAPKAKVSFEIGDIVPANYCLPEAINVSINQAALTGELLPQSKKLGDQLAMGEASLEGSAPSLPLLPVPLSPSYQLHTNPGGCKQGEAEGVIISTGTNSFFGHAALLVGQILAQIGSFCLIAIGIFVVAEILVMYAGYSSHRGLVLTTPSLSPVPTSELLSMAPLTVGMDGMVFVIEAGGVEAIHNNRKVVHLTIKCF
ncbi:Plasma membrane ATPase [Mycena venus]|uniref:Plasma membrane ATPase n=1 Tax=Mycena venus TaxID=2733690 RepID=A0A8H7CED3_9AGAR|nr:Plasma membrane ATPase [Mycena venus]